MFSHTRNLAEFSSISLGSLENASMEERFLIEFQAESEIHVTGLKEGEMKLKMISRKIKIKKSRGEC